MKKLVEKTYGTYIYMRMELSGNIEEISVYIRNDGWHYKTSKDSDQEQRNTIINAFNELY